VTGPLAVGEGAALRPGTVTTIGAAAHTTSPDGSGECPVLSTGQCTNDARTLRGAPACASEPWLPTG